MESEYQQGCVRVFRNTDTNENPQAVAENNSSPNFDDYDEFVSSGGTLELFPNKHYPTELYPFVPGPGANPWNQFSAVSVDPELSFDGGLNRSTAVNSEILSQLE